LNKKFEVFFFEQIIPLSFNPVPLVLPKPFFLLLVSGICSHRVGSPLKENPPRGMPNWSSGKRQLPNHTAKLTPAK
jgi:hypothetical protein